MRSRDEILSEEQSEIVKRLADRGLKFRTPQYVAHLLFRQSHPDPRHKWEQTSQDKRRQYLVAGKKQIKDIMRKLGCKNQHDLDRRLVLVRREKTKQFEEEIRWNAAELNAVSERRAEAQAQMPYKYSTVEEWRQGHVPSGYLQAIEDLRSQPPAGWIEQGVDWRGVCDILQHVVAYHAFDQDQIRKVRGAMKRASGAILSLHTLALPEQDGLLPGDIVGTICQAFGDLLSVVDLPLQRGRGHPSTFFQDLQVGKLFDALAPLGKDKQYQKVADLLSNVGYPMTLDACRKAYGRSRKPRAIQGREYTRVIELAREEVNEPD